MDAYKPEAPTEQASVETPEDVAILYSWANLEGAKYRDFSASRREFRAKVRHRAAQARIEVEQRAKREAEAAAVEAERAASEAEKVARFHEEQARKVGGQWQCEELEQEEASRVRASRQAEELSRVAAAEREEAARRAEAVRASEAMAAWQAREVAEARASAQRQAAQYAESEVRWRSMAGPQPAAVRGGLVSDPYQEPMHGGTGRFLQAQALNEEDLRPSRHSLTRDMRLLIPQPEAWTEEEKGIDPLQELGQGMFSDPRLGYEPSPRERATAVDKYRQYLERGMSDRPAAWGDWGNREWAEPKAAQKLAMDPGHEESLGGDSGAGDTLQESRERMAARWYALRGVFEPPAQKPEEPTLRSAKDRRAPMLALFSLSGGAGKTSLAAGLGRMLAGLGEHVLLIDTTAHGLLPFYFGASELKAGVVRTFSPPRGSENAPIYLVSYDVLQPGSDVLAQEQLAEEMIRNSEGVGRVMVDLTPHAPWLARRLARRDAMVLVPLAPDMNSVISLRAIERYFAEMSDSAGHMIQPMYLLNHFEASQPLHIDVREVLRQQLGDRLLPLVIRRSPAVAEALAEGMTVVDYAPEAGVAADYASLAAWLRRQAPPAAVSGLKSMRWSEQ